MDSDELYIKKSRVGTLLVSFKTEYSGDRFRDSSWHSFVKMIHFPNVSLEWIQTRGFKTDSQLGDSFLLQNPSPIA